MEELVFDFVNGVWECELPTYVRGGALQIVQKQRGIVSVCATCGDLEPSVISTHENPYSKSLMLNIDIPKSVRVFVRSQTEVTSAVWTA